MSDQIAVSISQESIQAIIKTHVQMAVMNALKPHSEQFVREMIEKSLLAKNEGSEYNRYKNEAQKITILEEITRKVITEEATKAIREWVEGHRDEIAVNMRKAIATQGFAKKWAMATVESMLAATTYGFKVDVLIAGKDQRS